MATAPTPIDFTQYEWALGDTTRMITQWNAMQAALTQYGQELVPFGNQMTSQMNAAISARQAAEAARDEAQEIVVGDTAITDLQPGLLDTPQDYVSVDAGGALVRRNLADDVDSAIATPLSGKRDKTDNSFETYDLDVYSSGPYLYVSRYRVIKVSVTSNKTLSFLGDPPDGQALTMVVHLYGSSMASRSVTWPSEITWSGGEAPVLDGTDALVLLFWNGSEWIGALGALS